jgi:hypothetical protein
LESPAVYADIVGEGKAEAEKAALAKHTEAIAAERARCDSILAHALGEMKGKGVEDIALASIKAGDTFDKARADMNAKALKDMQAQIPSTPGAVAEDSGDITQAAAGNQDAFGNLVAKYASENKCSYVVAAAAVRQQIAQKR